MYREQERLRRSSCHMMWAVRGENRPALGKLAEHTEGVLVGLGLHTRAVRGCASSGRDCLVWELGGVRLGGLLGG